MSYVGLRGHSFDPVDAVVLFGTRMEKLDELKECYILADTLDQTVSGPFIVYPENDSPFDQEAAEGNPG